ncbi:hypothetical protein CANARDRAFT_28058 [[Candida] arabinofermentans NRRL YB-2248]|uniref:Thiamine-binding protein domain-containing protein n=1 Tax=[Candida] arabinofermentans NRRL YB-2248 TaxID=983967 RepID=A0A1E4T2M5_9ASCO|nr:hypothetical protein CANARDRAFT_28058 [[Candida] arabinofermentans NRRL YB-2248]
MAVKLHCLADICLIPIGTPTPSVSDYVVAVEKLARESNLKSTLHSAGTTIEGEWTEVMELIGKMHERVHEMGIFRVQSDIRVGTRTDKSQTAQDKIDVVEEKLKRLSEYLTD